MSFHFLTFAPSVSGVS